MKETESIQLEKAALEAEVSERLAKIDLLSAKIQAIKKESELREKGRAEFPKGFTFGYNNRRGDPNYTCYWECILHDADGKEIWYQNYHEDRYTAHEARNKALEAAWLIYDVAQAIVFHNREALGADLRCSSGD